MMAKRQRLHTRSIISVPVPVDVGRRIVRAANAAGKPVAAFVREAALDRAERVLAKAEREAEQETDLQRAS